MVDIATASFQEVVLDKAGQPILIDGKPLTVKDAKMAMASVKAYEALMARVYGKIQPGDEELDALKVAGVKVVIVSAPDLKNNTVIEDKPREVIKPSFIEAEIVENKS